MIKTESWQQLGNALKNGERVFLNDIFHLFRMAGNERIRSIISGSRYSDYQSICHACSKLLGPDGYLQKHKFPLLDNWDAVHDSTPVPVADPDAKEIRNMEYKVDTPENRAITRQYILQIFENFNRLHHFPVGKPEVNKVYYSTVTVHDSIPAPIELYNMCLAAKKLQEVSDVLPFTGCTFDYFYNPETQKTTGVFSQTIVTFCREKALPDNGFSPETIIAPFLISAPSSSGTAYYSPPEGSTLQQGDITEISPTYLETSTDNSGMETLTGEYISPLFDTAIFTAIQEPTEYSNFRIGYSSTGSAIRQRNEFSNFKKYLC